MCFSEDGFLLNQLLSLGWIPLGGNSRFLYLLGGVSYRVVNQNSSVSLAKFLWVVLSVSFWVYLCGELIYPLNYWVFYLSHKTRKYKVYSSSLFPFIVSIKFRFLMKLVSVCIRALVQWLDIIDLETMVRFLKGSLRFWNGRFKQTQLQQL